MAMGEYFACKQKVTSVHSCLSHGAVCQLGLHRCLFNKVKQAGLGASGFWEGEEGNRIKQADAGTLHSSC